MKLRNFMLAALALSSINATANNLETVKVFDGTRADCLSKNDVTNRKNLNGAYRAKAKNIVITSDNKVEVELDLNFLKCSQVNAESETGFKFIPYSPLKKSINKVVALDGTINDVEVRVNHATARVFKDGVYSLLQKVDLKDSASQTHKISIPLEEVLSNASEKELELGQKVAGDFDIFIHKEVQQASTKIGYDIRTTARLGSFRVQFTVEDSANGLKANFK